MAHNLNPDGPILPSICVDASCIGNPGILEFRGVNVADGRILFERGPFDNGTNNIGEFLALVLGLAYIKNHHLSCPLYTDSVTAIAWLKKKHCRSTLQWDATNQILHDMVNKGELWLRTNVWETEILKWHTHLWGEIPADYNRK